MMLEVPGVLHLDHDFGVVSGLCCTHVPNFSSSSSFWRCKKHPCPISPHFRLWRTLYVPDAGEVSWSWFGYGHWSLLHPCARFWPSILILKVQRTSMSFKSSFGALKVLGFGGHWRFLTGFWHLDLDLDKVTCPWHTHALNFDSLSCREYPCPLSPDFWLWRTLEFPDWGLESW